MHENLASLDMTEELMTKPCSLTGAFNQSGDVRNNESMLPVQIHHAEIRLQCREMVVRDLGLRPGDP